MKQGKISIINMDCDYFLMHFSHEGGYKHALYEGPWMVARYYLIVQHCRPFFLSNEKVVRKVIV